MGPKLSTVTLFFHSDVLRLSTEVYMLSEYKDASQNSRLDILLFDSGQSCVDLSPIENYNFRWGPVFLE